MTILSIIVTLGFVDQKAQPGQAREGWDEFDHMVPLADVAGDIELIIVDRAWPSRWNRVEEALGKLLEQNRVVYIPPKKSKLVDNGYRACCSMRNAGAICSVGKLLAFVDDHFYLGADATDEVVRYFCETGGVLCPVARDEIDRRTPEGKPSDCGGHNAGIYMCTREQFVELNGFDEHFDGSYGEEDTEFQDRLDRLMWLKQTGFRKRHRGLLWPMTLHANGTFPQEQIPFWNGERHGGYLRCNRSYAHSICYPRIQDNRVRANIPLTKEEEVVLRKDACREECSLCHGADRLEQVASYNGLLLPSQDIGLLVAQRMGTARGKVDPW